MSDDTGERSDRTESESATADDDGSEHVGAYDKLVRDDIPAVVREDGNRPVTRRVDGEERRRYLAEKLVEEATEYRDAVLAANDGDVDNSDHAAGDGEEASSDGEADSDDDPVLDELADVHAVLDAVVDASGATTADVDARVGEKSESRGGFHDGVVLERIETGDGDDE